MPGHCLQERRLVTYVGNVRICHSMHSIFRFFGDI